MAGFDVLNGLSLAIFSKNIFSALMVFLSFGWAAFNIFEAYGLIHQKRWGLYLTYIYQVICGVLMGLMIVASLIGYLAIAYLQPEDAIIPAIWFVLTIAILGMRAVWAWYVIQYFKKRSDWFGKSTSEPELIDRIEQHPSA